MGAGTISQRVKRIPPFNDPRARKAFLRGRDRLSRLKRHALERAGSDRASRPALFDMDRALERHLPAHPGFFVEAGANDGYLQSNTYFLERFRGWTGVLVEPIPELYAACVRERPRSQVFNCALVSPETEGRPIPMHYGGLMSVVEGAMGSFEAERAHAEAGSQLGWDPNYDVAVPGRTLTSVLEEAGAPRPDLLSLDIEGFEVTALRGLDLERFGPRLLLVEVLEEPRRAEIEAVLGEDYALLERLSPYDLLYARRTS
jgi:FkbM family methyltransferase